MRYGDNAVGTVLGLLTPRTLVRRSPVRTTPRCTAATRSRTAAGSRGGNQAWGYGSGEAGSGTLKAAIFMPQEFTGNLNLKVAINRDSCR